MRGRQWGARTCKRVLAFALAVLLTVGSLYGGPATEVLAAGKAPTKITLSAAKKSVEVGKKFTLKVKAVTPKNASKKVTFKTSNKKVATVTKEGVVTGIKAGTAKITAVSAVKKSVQATCSVTVTPPTAKSIAVKDAVSKTLAVDVKKTITVKPSVLPQGAKVAGYTYAVKNKKIVTVTKKGKLKGVKAGKTTLTIKNKKKAGQKNLTLKLTVIVPKVPVTGVALYEKTMRLAVGERASLGVTVAPANATCKLASYSSSAERVATVDAKGNIRALAAGTAVITIKTLNNAKKASCTITVTENGGATGGNSEITGGSEAGGNSETTGGSEAGGNSETTGGSETVGNSETTGGSEVGGNSETTGGSETVGNSETTGGSEVGGNSETTGGSETVGNSETTGGSETVGNSETTGGSEVGGNSETTGGSETGDSEEPENEGENKALSGYVSATGGDLTLAASGKTTTIYVDANDDKSVARAVGNLAEDIASVTGITPQIRNGAPASDGANDASVIVGTIGKSAAVDALVSGGKLDVSAIKDKWESFTIQKVDDTLVIAGSDKRGTIFGVYDLCEKIGVSPWKWWADVDPVHADALYINLPSGGYTEGEPSVKYRGIFINDEFNLNQWSMSQSADGTPMSHETYEKVFELLLRMKANFLWPAMHAYSPAFHNDAENAKLADEYGIIMGSSHCEPLMRNNLGELDAFQDKWEADNPGKTLYKALKNESGKSVAYYWTDHDNNNNPVDNKEFLEAYWRESVRDYGGYDNVYTLGMRGVHDGSFQTNMDYATALQEIIDVQRKIIKEEICDKTGKDITDVPQVFIPYKDILKYYNEGSIQIPADVTIMWTDDNFGYVRQNANDTERANAGRTGIYYHISYYGYPTSYLWLTTTQPGLIREEMGKSYDMGADRMWILNVGDIKPAEQDIEYFLRLARDIKTRDRDISKVFAANARRDFNLTNKDAAEYAAIMDEFYELANAKRPEFIRSGEFSVTAYGDEAQRFLERCKKLTLRAEALYGKLAEEKKDAFFELALYPIRTFQNMMIDYIQTDRANLYAAQGRGMAPYQYAKETAAAVAQIDADLAAYNALRGGKWDKMMNNNPSKLQGCDAHITTSLAVDTPSSLDYTSLAVAVDTAASLGEQNTLSLSVYDTYRKFIDVVNQGYGSFDYTVSSDADYITFSKTEGTVNGSDRVYVELDQSKVPAGSSVATINVTQKLGAMTVDAKEITVNVSNPAVGTDAKLYVEAGGTVSIEAEHYSSAVVKDAREWKVEKDFGRSGNSVKAYPDLAADVASPDSANTAYLNYDVYFENSGTYTLDVYRMPTLNERGSMKFAVGVDNETPVILTGRNTVSTDTKNKNDPWCRGVLDNTQRLRTTVTIPAAGKHTLRLYQVSPGVVVDKMVLTHGTDVPVSYFGAPESYNTTYRTEMEETLPYTDTAATEQIKKAYEPDVLVGAVNKTAAQIDSVNLIKLTEDYSSAVVAVMAYDDKGNMTAVQIAKADLSAVNAGSETTVPVALALPDSAAAYAVTVFDSFANMQLIAPYKEWGTVVTEAETDGMTIKADLQEYKGKKSITLIADCEITEEITAEHIKYLYGETITASSYKSIPFSGNGQGVYYIRTGIYGENAIDERKNTVVNILPDNNGVHEVLNTWSFTSGLADDNGKDAFTVTGGASRTDDGRIKMNTTSTGTALVTYDNPVAVAQGGKVTVEFDIYYGKLSAKTMTYAIKDSAGNTLTSVKLSAYNPSSSNTSVMIGGEEKLEGDTGYTVLSSVADRTTNFAAQNGPTHYKNVFDFASGKATITVSSKNGTAEFSGKLGATTNNIKSILFETNYNNNERACLVDDVQVSSMSAPQYAMEIGAVNAADGSVVSGASITVVDDVSQAEIKPNDAGKYMLSEGDYTITAVAAGFRTAVMKFELTPALESKQVIVRMTSDADLQVAQVTVKYVDEESNILKQDTVITEKLYVGDSYSLPVSYQADIVIKNAQGKTDVYQFNPSASTTSTTLVADTVLTLVFNLAAQYDYYENFDAYTLDQAAWNTGAGKLYPTADKGVLNILSTGKSQGAYTLLPEIACAGKTVKIACDLKIGPASISGESQFSIGDTAPAFSSGNIDYGVKDSAGHIISLLHNKTTLTLNGQSISTGCLGSWVHMEADVDFASKKVTVKLTNDSGYAAEVKDVGFYSTTVGSTVGDSIGSLYLRAGSSDGSVSVDNLAISVTGDAGPVQPEIESVLNYKSVYAFGDSIVYGHNAPGSAFMNLIAGRYSMSLSKFAKNGATVIDSSNDIIAQIAAAPAEEPDIIVFDGYTNDAYGAAGSDSFNTSGAADVTQILGSVQGSSATSFDAATFCGAFEEILSAMKQKWPDSKIVFVTIHKSGARDFAIQQQLHDLTVQMCEAWGADVVDLFADCTLDTRNADEMAKYMIGAKGSHPNVACCEEFYVPAIVEKLTALCGE